MGLTHEFIISTKTTITTTKTQQGTETSYSNKNRFLTSLHNGKAPNTEATRGPRAAMTDQHTHIGRQRKPLVEFLSQRYCALAPSHDVDGDGVAQDGSHSLSNRSLNGNMQLQFIASIFNVGRSYFIFVKILFTEGKRNNLQP